MSRAGALRAVLRDLAWKALSLGFERGCRLVVTVAAAPVLGEVAFGRFVFASTVTAMLALAADLGVGVWTTRSLARAAIAPIEIVRVGLALRGFSAVPYALLIALIAWFFPEDDARLALVLLGVSALGSGFADHLGAILRGEGRFSDEARLNATRGVLLVAFGAVALAVVRSLVALSAALAAANLAALAYGVVALLRRHPVWRRRRPHSRREEGGRALARRALRESVPIWLAGLLSLLYFKVDTLFVRVFAGEAELGAYGVAYKVFEGALLVPAVVLAATFPRLARAFSDPPEQRRLERRLVVSLLALGLLVGAFCFLVRAPLITLVFGVAFVRAVDSLEILSLGLPLVYLNFGLTHFLIARHRERVNTLLALMMVIIVVTLDSLLVPRGSGPGAALATVLSEIVLTLGCLIALRRPTTPAPAPPRTAPASG